MATIASLVGDVQPMIAAAVPESAIKDAILWSAREFLRFSRWLRETVTVDVLTGTNAYALATSAPAVTEVFALQAAQFEGDYLTPATQEEVEPGTTGYFFFQPPGELILSWMPLSESVGGLLVRCVLNLKTDTTSIPDAVLVQWNNYISYGALSRLMSMASSPWANDKQAAYWEAKYTEGKLMARKEAEEQSKAYAYGFAQG